jgi:hypothetical protein
MSRGIEASMLIALGEPVVRPVMFVHIGFADPITLWTGLHDIDFAGLTFTPAAVGITVDPIVEKLDGSQPQLSISIEGLSPGMALAPSDTGGSEIRIYEYTGSQIVDDVPAGARERKVYLRGAGGGPDIYAGGFGGYTFAHHSVVPGAPYSIIVGQGGVNLTTVHGFGGTGQGTSHQHNGGGLTGIFDGDAALTASDYDRAEAIAGGGGAGSWNGSTGHTGKNGNDTDSGGLGTMQGQAATGGLSSGLGGGGGGYRGGKSVNQWGVGGSGYVKPDGLLSASEILGTPWPSSEAPKIASPYYDGIAGLTGQNGLAVVEFLGIPRSYDPIALVYLGALDADGALIGEPVLMFSGTVSDITWKYSATDIVASISMIGAPEIVEATTGQRYTSAGQKRKYPSDLGLDFVAAMQTQTLTWGTQ